MIVKWEMIRYIPNISFFLVILLLATFKGCESIGSCTKDGAVVATVQQEKAVLGSKQDGFRVKCDYTILDNTHTFALWRLRKTTTDFILSYIPSVNPSVVEGTNYNGRNLDFQDNSAVFPDYSCSDVAFLNLTCVLQLDGFTITCNDEMEQNIFATPNVTGVTFNPSQNVAVGTNVELTITAEDYKCFESPTFSVQIGNGEATPLVVTETSSGCFSSFTSTVTVTAASGNVKVNMMCGGDTETVDSGVAVPISDCDGMVPCYVLDALCIAAMVGVFIYLLIKKPEGTLLRAGIGFGVGGVSFLVGLGCSLGVGLNCQQQGAVVGALAVSIINTLLGVAFIVFGVFVCLGQTKSTSTGGDIPPSRRPVEENPISAVVVERSVPPRSSSEITSHSAVRDRSPIPVTSDPGKHANHTTEGDVRGRKNGSLAPIVGHQLNNVEQFKIRSEDDQTFRGGLAEDTNITERSEEINMNTTTHQEVDGQRSVENETKSKKKKGSKKGRKKKKKTGNETEEDMTRAGDDGSGSPVTISGVGLDEQKNQSKNNMELESRQNKVHPE